jgi:hypothetical protein
VISDVELEKVADSRPGSHRADINARQDPFAAEMAKAAAQAAATVGGAAPAAGHATTVDISDHQLGDLMEASVEPAAPAPAPAAPQRADLDTVEIARDDGAFLDALQASAESTPAAPPPSPPPVALKAPEATAANPFVHQAPTVPASPPDTGDETPDPDHEYFQKLFDQFVKTKEECGEDTEGLTMEKFVTRLEQNKAKLMQRYECRSVRFQVYVKKGKAALKATPVK